MGWRTLAGRVPGSEGLIGEDLLEGHSWTKGVMIAHHSWSGLLSCVCIVFVPHLPTGNVRVTREPETERKSCGMTLESMREHRPREKEDRESLMVF